MGRARGRLHGPADDGARRDDRERRAALDAARPRLLAGQPGLGDRRLHDRVRQLPPAGGTARRPARPQADVPDRPGRVHARVGGVRRGRQPGLADRRALRPGSRRRGGLGGGAGAAGHRVLRAARARDRDERLHLHHCQRRLDRAARRRRPHPGGQLALDLLHQRPDRHPDLRPRAVPDQRDHSDRPRTWHRRGRLAARHRRADAGRLRNRQGDRVRLAVGPHARLRRSGARAARGVRGGRVATRQSDVPAAHPARPGPRGLERGAGLPGHRDVLDLPARRAVPAARARLRRAARPAWPSCR